MTIAQADLDAIEKQLGRTPRGILEIVSRCPSGHPNVVKTEPRLDDGTPFPTMFYLTCDRLAGEIGTLEAAGLMREMTDRLAEDDDLAARYERAHDSYLAEREAIGHVPEIDGITAGGMPTRVKCLHAIERQQLGIAGQGQADVLGRVQGQCHLDAAARSHDLGARDVPAGRHALGGFQQAFAQFLDHFGIGQGLRLRAAAEREPGEQQRCGTALERQLRRPHKRDANQPHRDQREQRGDDEACETRQPGWRQPQPHFLGLQHRPG